MLTRVYYVMGILVLLGYGWSAYEGWELGNPVKMTAPPPADSTPYSSSGQTFWYHSSPNSSAGRGSGVGGFGGK